MAPPPRQRARNSQRAVPASGGEAYVTASAQPLHTLIFLLPLVVAYELGAGMYLGANGGVGIGNIRAHSLILGAFQDMGALGRFVPTALMLVVLLVWHVLARHPWRVRPMFVGAMLAESLLWTIPLLVLVALVQFALGSGAPAAAGTEAQGTPSILTLPVPARVTLSLGAGLYEEFLFRMVGIALLHSILVDVARLSERVGTMLAVLGAAGAFAFYHDLSAPSGGILWTKATSLVLAGAYFGVIYVLRGFGVVVAVHALYDVFVLVLLRRG